MRYGLLSLVWITTTGCIEYGLMKQVDDLPDPPDEDQGDTGLEEPPVEDPDCYDQSPGFNLAIEPELGWTDDFCFTSVDVPGTPYNHFRPGGRRLSGFTIHGGTSGSDVSSLPGGNVRLVQSQLDGASYSIPPNATYASGDLVASGSPGSWSALADDAADIGGLDACAPNCDYHMYMEVESPTFTSVAECYVYDPLTFCPRWIETTARRRVPAMSTCAAGSGTFRLFPKRMFNNDKDNNHTLLLEPVQVSGTGALTNAAWVRSIMVVDAQGQTLRVVRASRNFQIDSADQLVDSSVAAPLSGTKWFNPGVVSGGAPFVAVEVPGVTNVDFEVDMSWECGTTLDEEEVNAPQGYSFTLAEIGCNVSWPQRFTIRPVPTLAPKRLRVERYGTVADHRLVGLTPAPNGGHKFAYEAGGLEFRGRLVSFNATSASLAFDEISWGGIPLCSPGTRTLDAEE